MRRGVLATVLTATAAATAGCGTGAQLTASTTSPEYSCEDITVPGYTLTDGRRASELSAAGRRTVLQTEGVTRANLQTWRIVEDSTARVTIIRPLDRPEKVGDRVVASHQYVDRTPFRKTDPARPDWLVSIPLTCTLREVPPALSAATKPTRKKAAPNAVQRKAAAEQAAATKAATQKAAAKAAAQKAAAQKAAAKAAAKAPVTKAATPGGTPAGPGKAAARGPAKAAPAVAAPAGAAPAVAAPAVAAPAAAAGHGSRPAPKA